MLLPGIKSLSSDYHLINGDNITDTYLERWLSVDHYDVRRRARTCEGCRKVLFGALKIGMKEVCIHDGHIIDSRMG
jgi:hypothetical protein